MIEIQTKAIVDYTCFLAGKDEDMILHRARELKKDDNDCWEDREYIEEAIKELWQEHKIELYNNSIQSDFFTNEITYDSFANKEVVL